MYLLRGGGRGGETRLILGGGLLYDERGGGLLYLGDLDLKTERKAHTD